MQKLLPHFVFFLLSSIIGLSSYAQCPVDVSLTTVPDISNAPFCKSTPIQITANPSAGAVTPTYLWVINGDTVAGTGATINILANNQTVQVFMNTNTGCVPDFDSSSIFIETVIITSEATPITFECNQTAADVLITASGGQSPYNYNLLGVSSNNTGLFNSVPVGSYQVIITDDNGCTDTNIVVVPTFNCPDPIPFDVFTPNGDGFNDTWFVRHLEFYPKNEVFIFDRWGQRVYHKKNYKNNEGWEAKYLGGDLPVSTYYYILKIEPENSDTKTFKGAVSIIR